ncbi:DUF4148 domain-containing protein [Paraburkholderia sp. JHI869]|uniref:DUF4148 domain-containing protein n=1 Tax=Paraburkholderia sp. JHI869 TaxID=3112959 RepID=UPI00316D9127
MKTSVTLAALLVSAATALAAAPAFAGDDTAAPRVQSLTVAAVATNNAPKTRAEVKAELASARAHGELSLDPNSPAYPQQYAMGGYTAPREQVTAGFFHLRSAAN